MNASGGRVTKLSRPPLLAHLLYITQNAKQVGTADVKSQGSGWPKAFQLISPSGSVPNSPHIFWWLTLVVYTLENHDHCHRKRGTTKN